MSKYWQLKTEVDAAFGDFASTVAELPTPLLKVLFSRGFADVECLEQYLNPQLSALLDPFLLPDMEKAVARIWTAIQKGESITVYGDYDADGVTSTALMYRVLKDLGAKVDAFIPHRMTEGYGLSPEAVSRCLEVAPASLLVTVDCGINAKAGVATAREVGVEVIVTDHHEPSNEKSDAYAVVNPKLGAIPEYMKLAGVGVAFKVAHALVKFGRGAGGDTAQQLDLRNYLDLVAIGTVTDIMPLVGENRIIVKYGLERIQQTKWAGLRALKEISGIRGAVETYHLGFQLGPRINAVGRIGHPLQAFKLLTTDDPQEARLLAEELNRTNQERKQLEKSMADEAFDEIQSYFSPADHYGLVVAKEGWHPGVVGIVASRVSRHFNRPSVVLGIDEQGIAQGSCRSVEGFNLLYGLRSCERDLLQYGGHKMAAGVQLSSDRIERFRTQFNSVVESELKHIHLRPTLTLDGVLELEDINWEFYGCLCRLRPFGQKNPEPVWMLREIELQDAPRKVGRNHLKFTLNTPQGPVEAIAFNYPIERFPRGPIDIACTLKENIWNGDSSLQLQIVDVRPASVQGVSA